MFKITFRRMREERNKPREVKKISSKMLKERKNDVKRNIFLFDEVKKHSRTSPDVQFKEFSLTNRKLDLERTMNGVGKPFRKKSNQKNWKNSKNQSEIAACEQKPLARRPIFVQTPFSHSTLKLERKNFTPPNHSLFRSISCFGVTKITTPIWLQKSWKCVNRY